MNYATALFASLLLLLATPQLCAEQNEQQLQHRHQIGMAVSLLSGSGLHYQYIFSPDWRIGVSGFFWDEAVESREQFMGCFEGELQWSIAHVEAVRFYTLFSAGTWRETETDGLWQTISGRRVTIWSMDEKTTYTSYSLGLGVEWMIFSHVALHINAGAQLVSENHRLIWTEYINDSSTLIRRTTADSDSFAPDAKVGISYAL